MDDHNILIRKATQNDAELLAELGKTSFIQAFGNDNTPQDMAAYIAASFSPAIQAGELSLIGCTFILIYCDNVPVGYARLQSGSRETCITATKPVELVRFYLIQEWIGKGIAGRLMQACLDQARQDQHDLIWLGVWKENPRAIAFYRKWGFQEVGEHTFLLGTDLQHDAIMARALE